MLTYLLAFAVGLSSLALYLSAFFYPEVYRKGDLIWSGVGLFYALVLWVCAERITGGVLLGQMASVSLIGWLGWQALNSRLQTSRVRELPTATVRDGVNQVLASESTTKLKQQFNHLRDRVQSLIATTPKEKVEPPTAQPYQPLNREDFGRPVVTVETEPASASAKSATVEGAAPQTPIADQSNLGATIARTVKSIAASFQKPKKNTSTYVRKEFRDAAPQTVSEDVDADAFELEVGQAVEPIAVPSDAPAEPPAETPAEVAPETSSETDPEDLSEALSEPPEAPSDCDTQVDEVMLEEIEFEAHRNDLELLQSAPPRPSIEVETHEENPDLLQPIPPHPPTPDLVEAAIADAEAKHLSADPPDPIVEIAKDES